MTRKIFLFEVLLIAAASAATYLLYSRFPAQVPIHWNIHMTPDDYAPKWALWLVGPGSMTLILLLTWLFPLLSPNRFRIDSFWSTYHRVMLLCFGVMAYLYATMLWSDCGRQIDMGQAVLSGICLFIVFFGNLMGKLRRNFYVGIKTPWTLASERVWNATHRFAARFTMIGGLLGMVFAFAGMYLWTLLALLLPSFAAVAYSLIYYKQLEKRGEIGDGLSNEQGEHV